MNEITAELTGVLLAEIRARVEAASPGPWPTPAEAGDPYDPRIPVDHEGCQVTPWGRAADMVFAYRARSDVPWLLAEVERLARRLVGMDHDLAGTTADLEQAEAELARLRATLEVIAAIEPRTVCKVDCLGSEELIEIARVALADWPPPTACEEATRDV